MVKVEGGDLGELLVLIENERREKQELEKQISDSLMWKKDITPAQNVGIMSMTYVISFEPLGLSL